MSVKESYFGGADRVEPGIYTQRGQALPQESLSPTFGNVAVVDTGYGAGYGVGAGVVGETASGSKAIYRYSNSGLALDDTYGAMWKLTESLFSPMGALAYAKGATSVNFARLAFTRASILGFGFSNGSGTGAVVYARLGVNSIKKIYNGGVGFAVNDTITILGNGTNATLTVLSIGDNGNITSLGVSNAGIFDETNISPAVVNIDPKIGVNGVTTSGNGVDAHFLIDYKVVSLNLDDNGSGYSTTQPVTVFVQGGQGVVITAIPTTGGALQSSDLTLVSGGNEIYAYPKVYILPQATNGGYIEINTKHEGVWANGVLEGGVLKQGYAMKVKSGVNNPQAIIVELSKASFKGIDPTGVAWNNRTLAASKSKIIATSGELSRYADLVNFFENNPAVADYFKIRKKFIYGSGDITAFSLSQNDATILAQGGNESYHESYISDFTIAAKEKDIDIILSTDFGLPSPSIGVTLPTLLSMDSSVNGQMKRSFEQQEWTFSATAGQQLSVRAIPILGGIDPVIDIFSPAGVQLFTSDDITVGTKTAGIDFTVATTGVYKIRVRCKVNIGYYTLKLYVTANGVPASTELVLNGGAQSFTNIMLSVFANEPTNTNRVMKLWIAAGYDILEFPTSIATSELFNNERVCVWHGGAKRKIAGRRGFVNYDQLQIAALVVGREAGLDPQTPISQKSIDIIGYANEDDYTLAHREEAIRRGVTMAKFDGANGVINTGWNSLQFPNDQNLINSDIEGTSPSMTVLRIDGALDKLIRAWGKPLGLGGGKTVSELNQATVLSAWRGFWENQLAASNSNKLIVEYIPTSLTVTLEDNVRWRLSAEYKPNTEIYQTFVSYNKVL